MPNFLWKIKTKAFEKSEIDIENLSGFFKPFKSLSDARQQVKAPLLMPLIDLKIALKSSINILIKIGEIVVNLATGNCQVGGNILNVFKNLAVGVYFTVSILMDTLLSLTALITRSAVTIGSGVVSGVQYAVNCCPSSELSNIALVM